MSAERPRPLADRLRPQRLEQVIGQAHLLGPGRPLRLALASGRLHSLVLWGPPGTGKTTLARLMASCGDAAFVSLSAVLAGVKDVREAVRVAHQRRAAENRGTLLFVDEVHRFNKAQQDAFLPHIEDGTLLFVGATTENPSFALNNALLSRLKVYVLKSLQPDELGSLLEAALQRAPELNLTLDDTQRQRLIGAADGDGRRLLVLLELIAELAAAEPQLDTDAVIDAALADGVRRFDRGGDLFYDQISALHKSIRGSSPDAALYWLARLLDGGCDPRYLARRLLRVAAEDIGNADPRALRLALDAWESYERLGSPEGELMLSQAVVYLACAAKSNAVYLAHQAALEDARRGGTREVPERLRNAPTTLARDLGHGGGYRYAHDEDGAYAAGENYFPDDFPERRYYQPSNRGLEIKIAAKLEQLRERDRDWEQQRLSRARSDSSR